jgi:hypothetical protein
MFVVMAHKTGDHSINAVHHYTLISGKDLEDIVEEDTLINSSNIAGKLYVHNRLFSLVPTILFDPSHTELYLNFSADLETENDRWEICYEGIQNNTIQVVGATEKKLLGLLDSKIPELDLAHGASLTLAYFMEGRKDLLNQEIFIHIIPESIYIAGFRGGELMVFNQFPVTKEADFLKYVLTVIQQLAFDRVHCKITLLGNLELIHCKLENLQLYFKNIQETLPPQKIRYQPGAEEFKNTRLLEAFWLE